MGWKGYLVFLGILAAWIVLNRWVLPMCGIDTCCCSSSQCDRCDLPPDATAAKNQGEQHQGETP